MRLIDLHKKWCESGNISDRKGGMGWGGLCNAVPIKYDSQLSLFQPKEYKTYWASGIRTGSNGEMYAYGSLRQTIVLLICAINNEL